MLTKTLLKAPPKASNVVPVVGGAAATSKDLEALVTSVCGRGDWGKAAKLISGAHRLSMVPTWRTYKALLQCMARQQTHWQASVSIINHMSGGQMGTHALYRSFVSLCAEAGDGETAQRVLEEAGRRGVGMPHSVYMAVAKCYVTCEMHAALMELPALMVKDRVPVTNDMLDTLLEGCAHCQGTMAENAKMILERAGGEKGVTAHMAEHYLLSLAATDWELGTRQYLSMPYGVRQEGAVMAALAALMMRGGRWDTSLELIERQLWAVKDFNNKTVDETIDERVRQIISEARRGSRSSAAANTNDGNGSSSSSLSKPSNSAAAVVSSWQEAEKEATRLYFMRKGYTAQSGDLVLDAIFLSVPRGPVVQEGVNTVVDTMKQQADNNSTVSSEEKEEQIIAATRFISKSKQKVPTVFFSPKSLRPLLLESSVEWEVGYALLKDFFEFRQQRPQPSTEPPPPTKATAPLSSPPLSTSDESAVAAYLSRPNVPMAVVTELIPHVQNLQSHTLLLGRLAEGGGRVGEMGASLSFSTPSTAGREFVVSEGLDLVVSRLGPHETAVAYYNMGMWQSALRILEAHVRGPDELTETILLNHRLWREALAYAERCPLEVREETLRSFAVPVCSVCGQWEEVERTLDRIGAVTDVEKLLLREARRRGREKSTHQLVSRRLYRDASECWLSFYAEESVLALDKKLGNPIVVGLLDTELLLDESTRGSTEANKREEKGPSSSSLLANLVTEQVERALAVARHGPVKDLSSPCGALVGVEKEFISSSVQTKGITKAKEISADPNRLAAQLLVYFSKYTISSIRSSTPSGDLDEKSSSSKRSELASIITDVLRYFESYNQPSNNTRDSLKRSLLATGVFVDALALSVTSLLQRDGEEQHTLSYSAWRSLPLSLVKTLGGTSAAVDASLQRFAVMLAEAHMTGCSAPNAKLPCAAPSTHHTATSNPAAVVSPSSSPLSKEEESVVGRRGIDWDRLLTVYEHCSHVSLPSMESMICIAMADLKAPSQSVTSASSEVSPALQIVTLKTALMPAALKALSSAANTVSTSDVTAGASLLGLKTVTGLANTVVELAVRLGDYGVAMRVYSDYPQLIAQGPNAVDRFLDVCSRTSGQSEKTLAAVAKNRDPISRTRYLLSAGQHRLAARYYVANRHAMNSSGSRLSYSVSSSVVPSLLHSSSSVHEEKGAPNPRVSVLREVLWALLREKDPVTCAELAQRETLADVGVELIQPILVGLTTPSLSWGPSTPFMLLHAVRFMEWLADEDPKLATDARMSRLLNVCAIGAPPSLPSSLPSIESAGATTLQHNNHTHALKLSLRGLRRIADKTSQHKVVNSLVAWINIGEAEAEDDLFAQKGESASIADLFFPQSRQRGLSSPKLVDSLLGKKGTISPLEQLGGGGAEDAATANPTTTTSVWTEERKQRLAKYYPLLAERAPPTRQSSIRAKAAVSSASLAGVNTTNTMSSDPFLHVAVIEFAGEVTAEDVRALWYGANGGYRRHLSRLHDLSAAATRAAEGSDQTQRNVEAVEQGTFFDWKARITTPSSSTAGLSSASHTTNANTSSKREEMSELHALASNIVTIRFGTEVDIRGLCEMSAFRGHTTESLRRLAFKSGAAIKATLRDHPSLSENAHLQVPNPLPQQLVARLSDYCGRGDMSSPALWRAIAMQVFQGAVTTAGVGAIIRRHQTLLRNAADQRWSREAEREIADCVAFSGAPPSFLESDRRRAKHEIRRYYQRFHWVIRQQGSFVASELDDIAEAVAYPSFHLNADVDGDGIRGRAVSDALELCISTHTEEEVQRFTESREGLYRLVDVWHASAPLTSFAFRSAPLDISRVASDSPRHPHPLLEAVIKDTPLIPRTGHLSPRALPLVKRAEDAPDGKGAGEGLLSSSNSSSTPALAVAKRLAAHEFKDKSYITFRTAKTVLASCDGVAGIRSAVDWLVQHGFKITLEEAKRMNASRDQHNRRDTRDGTKTRKDKYPSSPSSSSSSSPPPPIVANKERSNSTQNDVWLRMIAHLPLLHGACTVLSTSSSTLAAEPLAHTTTTAPTPSPQHAKAAAIAKSELIRLAKGRTTRGDAKEAWSLLLRYGTDKWLSPSDRLDVAVAMAGV